jgi:hypothetical protein
MQLWRVALEAYKSKAANYFHAIDVETAQNAKDCAQVPMLNHGAVRGRAFVGNQEDRRALLALAKEVLPSRP